MTLSPDATITRTPSAARWHDVCAYADLTPERGACAFVEGTQVALFRTHDGALHAVANLDPFSGAQVLSRGILGTRDGAPTVASPMYKQVFDLRTGVCLDDPRVALPTFPVRRGAGGDRVEVALAHEQRQ
ncbi:MULTISPECIES: nitrite reductase small subunit NirD [Actinomadura]|uniref:Nitrite reductase small subunit NirD n=1 Tax=Actinomadura yumaensis TaxID=111807 RepID=A0ABW2CTU1_9ACTN|nr:nitrite reductase small subunit NirD [Actinomadura sp. J1-007]MWK39727.1 nitrite reductase small subunit NirD [Actinomadura sp. J1-007]